MTVPPSDNSADLHAEIVALRAERDAAVARQATRDSDYTERAAHQGATVEVLRAMAGSRGDPKPVFEVIVRRTRDLCDAYSASLAQVVDGSIVLRAYVIADEAAAKQHEANFPRPLAADTMFGRAILARKPVQLPDVAADQTYGLREGTLRGSVRAQASVPLMRDGEAIGAINITRRQTGEFSPAQIELLQTFAAQAVIAINSAETDRNLREALEQQTATAELLQVINASPGNLALVFDTMLEKALRLCEAAFGVLLVRDGDHFRTAALHGVPPALAEVLADTPRRPGKHTAVGRMLDGEEFVQFEDMTKEPAYLAGDPRQQAFVELGGARTYVAVALRKDADLVGSIAAYRRDVRQFSQMQIALLRNFATQAVIAMENARLLNEMREALEQQTATADVLGVINASPGDLAPVSQVILEMAHRLCGSTLGSLLTFDGTRFTRLASHGYPAHMAATLQVPYPPQPRHEALLRGERFVQIMDLRETGIGPNEPISREVTDTLGLRTGLYVPLRKDGRLVGLISSYRQEVRPFSDRHIALLENFAAQAVVAMENARLLTGTREALERQTATSEILRVIAHSPTDVQPVFDAIVASAARVCEAEFGAVARLDQGLLHLVAVHSTSPEETAAFHQLFPRAPTRNFAMGRAFVDAEPVYFDDLLTWSDYDNRTREGLPGSRSFLAVPILRDGRPVGVVGCGRREVNPFTGTQIELLKTFADQAAIAIENVRLFNELETRNRELSAALDQQTATAEVLQVINNSPGDLAPVFDAMLEKATRLCQAEMGTLWTYDGEYMQPAAMRGAPPPFAEFLKRGPHRPNSAQSRILRGERVIHSVNTAEGEAYRSGDPLARAAADLGGIRTILVVSLRKDDAVRGTIGVYRQEVRPFTDKQIALLQNFAAQAVIAMENARLLTEQREALEQQTATAEVLQVINASPGDLTPVFDAMLERAMRLCGASFGILRIKEGGRFHGAASRGVPAVYAEFLAHNPQQPQSGSIGARILNGEPLVHVIDVADDTVTTDPHRRALVELGGARTTLVVALKKDRAVLGAIQLYRQHVQAFTDKQIALLQNFAAQAVIAMENARLLNEQREALEQQTATAEVLQIINASPGNLAPVFDAMLEKATRLCEADAGVFCSYDGESFLPAAFSGFAEFPRDAIRPHPETGIGRLARGENIVHILDSVSESAYQSGDPGRLAIVQLGGARTQLAASLRKDDKLLGSFTLWRREVRAFTDKQIALLQTFAAQAVIAMENARLLHEQREALEQQTATAEVLQVINASPGDLNPVFDAILKKAHLLCGAEYGVLLTYDGKVFWPAAVHGDRLANSETFRRGLRPGFGFTKLIRGERLLHIHDMAALAAEMPDDPVPRALFEISGIRTQLAVPLRRDDNLLGIITANRREVRPFMEKEIALLENFAAQAVIAMENARLLNEQREALEQQTATAEVLQVINSSPGELAPVFDAMLEKAMRLCGAAMGGIYSYDGEWFEPAALRGVTPEFVTFSANPVPKGLLAPTLIRETKRPVQIPDLADTSSYAGKTIDSSYANRMIDLGNIRAVLDVPLLKEGTLLGFIAIYREEAGAFPDKQIALLESFAAQAVIAMENARLLNEIRQRQEELRVTFENMGDGVALFDETRHLVASNQRFQRMLDVPDDVISSRPAFVDYLRYLADRGEYGPDPEDHVQRLLAFGGQPTTFERTRPNGSVIEVRGNPVPGGGFVVIYSDITERKRNEEALRAARDAAEEASRTIEAAYRDLKAAQANLIQAEKMASLGQLTAGIAHEIKNPLNFVNNFAALSVDLLAELKETAAPGFAALSEKQRVEIDDVSAMLTSNLEKITEHGNRADRIVKAMLEHSRGSSGERRTVDLNALIDEALNLAYHGARAQDQSFNITLERDFGAGIAPIEINPQDMTRVFLNLFSNGFYATTKRARDGGDAGFVPTLKVTTRSAGDAVEIRVRDNGTGIPADIRDKLFQPFFTTKPTGEGTGLGLSITYDIVTQQHGGSIAVDSKVGEYSEFTIRLPRNR